jgi:hypothetical protein
VNAPDPGADVRAWTGWALPGLGILVAAGIAWGAIQMRVSSLVEKVTALEQTVRPLELRSERTEVLLTGIAKGLDDLTREHRALLNELRVRPTPNPRR